MQWTVGIAEAMRTEVEADTSRSEHLLVVKQGAQASGCPASWPDVSGIMPMQVACVATPLKVVRHQPESLSMRRRDHNDQRPVCLLHCRGAVTTS